MSTREALAKVPAVTFWFWLVKILATTLGETAGDAVTMSLGLGYAAGTAVFAVMLVLGLAFQIRSRHYRPALFWAVIIATTTVGTTLADFCDRSLGIGYLGGSCLLSALLMMTLIAWHFQLGSVSIARLDSRQAEGYYWATVLFSQTLGTALGDWVADAPQVGFGGGALLFAAGLGVVVALSYWTRISRAILFWAAFILTRPLGATVGDYLDKPLAEGGLALSRFAASGVLLAAIILLLWLVPQRAERLERAP